MYHGQTGSYQLVGRISTDKRPCIDWPGHLPGGRQTGSYLERGSGKFATHAFHLDD
jgi:hypothetical protein